MGNVYAEIIVKNSSDLTKVREGSISEKDVRTVTLTALVDTDARSLVIDENISQQLGLAILEDSTINIAGGATAECKVTEPVTIQWKDRQVAISAVVMKGGRTLLGVVPLEFMDLIVDPVRRELTGAHGDRAVLMAM